MKVLGCIGAGSFGKVFKVKVGDDFFAVKRVSVIWIRSLLSSIARMIVGTCNRYKNRQGYWRSVCIIPILSDITLHIDREITIALLWSMSKEDPSAISACPLIKRWLSPLSLRSSSPSSSSRRRPSYIEISSLPTSCSQRRDSSRSWTSESARS